MKNFIKSLFVFCMCFMLLVGCGNKKDAVNNDPQIVEHEASTDTKVDADVTNETTKEDKKTDEIFVYIGTKTSGFKEYPVSLDGDLTAEKLINSIAELTGWNLNLADEVISGKGGMSVNFSQECSLVTGPPMEQKDEFHVFDNYSLAQNILDSIEETLQKNFVGEPGDPKSLDIWYSLDDKPIEIEGLVISMDEPWGKQKVFG